MLKWIAKFHNADREMKWFILSWLFYGIVIIASTLYAYARLDYVRSYESTIPDVKETKTTKPT